jgi:hypothetical protein
MTGWRIRHVFSASSAVRLVMGQSCTTAKYVTMGSSSRLITTSVCPTAQLASLRIPPQHPVSQLVQGLLAKFSA